MLDRYCIAGSAVVMHHAHFDGLILAHHYGVYPRLYIDTLSMARAMIGNHLPMALGSLAKMFSLPEKTVPYQWFDGKYWEELTPQVQEAVKQGAMRDVEIAWEVFTRLARVFPMSEYPIVDMTIRMFTRPVLRGDLARLQTVEVTEQEHKRQLLETVGVTDASILRSDTSFAATLQNAGCEPGTKQGKLGPIYAFAKTDQFMLGLLDGDDPYLEALAEARLRVQSSIVETRARRLQAMAQRGPLCVYLAPYAAVTTRWGGGDKLNWQNMTPALQTCVEGDIIKADASQIECVAEGQLVLTGQGPKAIQNVELTDLVWDGEEFVRHAGVIYKGVQETICYAGLAATPEHFVYPRGDRYSKGLPLSAAATLGLDISSALPATSVRETSLRGSFLRWLQDVWGSWCAVSVRERGSGGALGMGALAAPDLQRLGDRSHRQRWSLRAWQLEAFDAARECQQSLYDFMGAYGEWRTFCHAGLHSPSFSDVWTRSDQELGGQGDDRGRDHNALQAREMGNGRSVQAQTSRTLQKVYDIVNCGPRRRFWCNGVIVSNCRLLNHLAGQTDVVDRFRAGADPYVAVASEFYGRPITKQDDPGERQVGKVLELQCGYGSGAAKIAHTLKLAGVILDEVQAIRARDAYRNTHRNVVQYWGHADAVLAMLVQDKQGTWGPLTIRDKRLWLPNGLPMIYDTIEWSHKPVKQDNGDYRMQPGYWVQRRSGWQKLYGAKLVENCLNGDAQILTVNGWCAIRDVQLADLLWDGEEWVAHSGVVCRGVQEIGFLDGVGITADHEVLTTDGWVRAASAQGLQRAAVRLPDGRERRRIDGKQTVVGSPLRLREQDSFAQWRDAAETFLRVPELRKHAATEDARYVPAPSLRGMAVDAGSVPLANASGVEKLRRARDWGLRGVAAVREFLARYGAFLSAGIDFGTRRQQRELLVPQLPMGYTSATSAEQTFKPAISNSVGEYDSCGSGALFGYWGDYDMVSDSHGMARRKMVYSTRLSEPVFDVMNCGPRHRFVVRGASGPFIVSNCVQAIARTYLSDVMNRLLRDGVHILLSRHDDLIIHAPSHQKELLAYVEREMCCAPEWMADCPLGVEASVRQKLL